MGEPFIGEISIFSYLQIPPNFWMECDGRLLEIAEHKPLFSIISNLYGGDGKVYFKIPDLRGRTPLGAGKGERLSYRRFGEIGGAETVTLSIAEMPRHYHQLTVSNSEADGARAEGKLLASGSERTVLFSEPEEPHYTIMDEHSIGPSGGSQGHPNMQPYLCLRFCIAYKGLYPFKR